MWGRLGPRFAVETAFLILLAVGLGLADEDWVVIVAVMAAGWALVSLIELVASRRPAAQWNVPRQETAGAPVVNEAPSAPVPPVQVAAPPSAPVPGPVPVLEEPAAPPEAAAESPVPQEDTLEVPPPAGQEVPQQRRRWFRRRKDEDVHETVPEPMKHVRRLEPEQAEEHSPAESAERH